jgi:hypothetical protein
LRKCSLKKNEKKSRKKNVLVLRRPEDEAISLFTGLLANPDMTLNHLNLTQETIWNTSRTREMARPLKPAEHKRIQEGIPRETVMKEIF